MEWRCHKSALKSGIKGLQSFKVLSKSLRSESTAENLTGEQHLGEIKELKHFIRTNGSLKLFKDFVNKPNFLRYHWWSRMKIMLKRLSKVTPTFLNDVVKGTSSMMRSGCWGLKQHHLWWDQDAEV